MTPPGELTITVPQERFAALEQAVQRIEQAITGGTGADPGIKGTQADHESRIKRLEGVVRWMAGIGTACLTTLAVAAVTAASILKR